jgi:hypothetical protein
MDPAPQRSLHDGFLGDCDRIHREWDLYAKSLNTEA